MAAKTAKTAKTPKRKRAPRASSSSSSKSSSKASTVFSFNKKVATAAGYGPSPPSAVLPSSEVTLPNLREAVLSYLNTREARSVRSPIGRNVAFSDLSAAQKLWLGEVVAFLAHTSPEFVGVSQSQVVDGEKRDADAFARSAWARFFLPSPEPSVSS